MSRQAKPCINKRTNDLLDVLRAHALSLTRTYGTDQCRIRGIWKIDLLFQPYHNERLFTHTLFLAGTSGLGCAYCSDNESPTNLSALIGRDAREVVHENPCIQTAIIDALFALVPATPDHVINLCGPPEEKATRRAEIVAAEATRAFAAVNGSHRHALNVGAVGCIIAALQQAGFTTEATDLDGNVIGKSYHGTTVIDGRRTLDMVDEAGIVVVSGMALVTGTMNDIIARGRKVGAAVVVFAETGSHLASEYIAMGADAVIAEPFPFYIFPGPSQLRIFRRKGNPGAGS